MSQDFVPKGEPEVGPLRTPEGEQAVEPLQVNIVVGQSNGCVVVQFHQPVPFIAMPPKQALALAEMLITNAHLLTPPP